MSVEKLDHVRLIQEKHPYTLHMNYVLQNIKDPLSLAIWVYLTSLPDDWKVHRTQLMEHFDVGRDKLGNALKFLNENRLIEYIQELKESGKFGIGQILVKCGYEFEVIHRMETGLLKNRSTVSPLSGETAPTNTIQNTNTIKNKNKSFCLSDQKAKNEKKHAFADDKKSPMASVEDQSTSYNKTKTMETAEQPSKHVIEYQKRQSERTAKRADELPPRAEVPAEIPNKGHNGGQGAAITPNRGKGDASKFRGRHGLLAACSSRLSAKASGVAGDEASRANTIQARRRAPSQS